MMTLSISRRNSPRSRIVGISGVLSCIVIVVVPQVAVYPVAKADFVSDESSSTAVFLIRFGHDATSISAAGAESSDASAAIAMIGSQNMDMASITGLQSAREAADQDVTEIRESIWRSGASHARISELSAAMSVLAARQAALDHAENTIRADISELLIERFGADSVALMARYHSNRDRRVPDEFKALDLDDVAWQTLEAACIKSSRGITLSTDESSILTQCQSNSLAILVASRLATNLGSIEAVFDATFATQD